MKKSGFTLIELSIVIAIIGILAAVLTPNLLAARNLAQLSAAQAHSSLVFTTATAHLASDARLTPSTAVGANTSCLPVGRVLTFGQFSTSPTPANVTACTVVGDDATGQITVTVTADPGRVVFVNGVRQD